MAAHENISLSLEELAEIAERGECVACGRGDAQPLKIPFAAGATVADLNEYLPEVSICPGCGERLAWLPGQARFRAGLAMAVAMLASVSVAVLLPIPSPIAPVIGALVGVVLGFWLFKVVRRRAAAAAPLLILGGSGRIVSFRRAATGEAADTSGAGPYRSSTSNESPPRVEKGLPAIAAGSGSLLLGLIIGTSTVTYIGTQSYPEVELDNTSDDTYVVVIDGGIDHVIEAGGRTKLRLRYGPHRFAISGRDGEEESLELILPWGKRYLLAVPEASCYTLTQTRWRWNGRIKRDIQAQDRGADCGRWLHID